MTPLRGREQKTPPVTRFWVLQLEVQNERARSALGDGPTALPVADTPGSQFLPDCETSRYLPDFSGSGLGPQSSSGLQLLIFLRSSGSSSSCADVISWPLIRTLQCSKYLATSVPGKEYLRNFGKMDC